MLLSSDSQLSGTGGSSAPAPEEISRRPTGICDGLGLGLGDGVYRRQNMLGCCFLRVRLIWLGLAWLSLTWTAFLGLARRALLFHSVIRDLTALWLCCVPRLQRPDLLHTANASNIQNTATLIPLLKKEDKNEQFHGGYIVYFSRQCQPGAPREILTPCETRGCNSGLLGSRLETPPGRSGTGPPRPPLPTPWLRRC